MHYFLLLRPCQIECNDLFHKFSQLLIKNHIQLIFFSATLIIILVHFVGEWWNGNTQVVETTALSTGAAPNVSDAATINGYPGPLYNQSNSRKC